MYEFTGPEDGTRTDPDYYDLDTLQEMATYVVKA